MIPCFITTCAACGKRVRYARCDSSAVCPRCGIETSIFQPSDDGRGAAAYNGEIEDVLRWNLALPD